MKPPEPCRLCGRLGKLRQSHIIPEYLYQDCYEVGHKMNLVSTMPRVSNGIVHKGVWDTLLGDCCEDRLKKFEDAVRVAFYGSGPGLNTGHWREVRTADSKRYFRIAPPDSTNLRLFQLSVLWRAHHSKHPLFSRVTLPVDVEKYLRDVLCGNEADDVTRLPCLMAVGLLRGNIALDGVLSPDRYYLKGIETYQFWFGGILWTYMLPLKGQINANPTHQLTGQDSTLTLILPAVEVSETQWFKAFLAELVETGRLADANRRAGLT